MQIEHPNFLIKIYFVNIKQTTQLQLVPEDKVAILCIRFPMSGCGCRRMSWLSGEWRDQFSSGSFPKYCGLWTWFINYTS